MAGKMYLTREAFEEWRGEADKKIDRILNSVEAQHMLNLTMARQISTLEANQSTKSEKRSTWTNAFISVISAIIGGVIGAFSWR